MKEAGFLNNVIIGEIMVLVPLLGYLGWTKADIFNKLKNNNNNTEALKQEAIEEAKQQNVPDQIIQQVQNSINRPQIAPQEITEQAPIRQQPSTYDSFRQKLPFQLTDNFSLNEFSSKDGSITPEKIQNNIKNLAQNLQVLRNIVKKPINITSGYRSPKHNANVGGESDSQHLLGKAADIQIEGMSPKQIYTIIEKLITEGKISQGGLGLYTSKGFVHYDIRGTAARWGK